MFFKAAIVSLGTGIVRFDEFVFAVFDFIVMTRCLIYCNSMFSKSMSCHRKPRTSPRRIPVVIASRYPM